MTKVTAPSRQMPFDNGRSDSKPISLSRIVNSLPETLCGDDLQPRNALPVVLEGRRQRHHKLPVSSLTLTRLALLVLPLTATLLVGGLLLMLRRGLPCRLHLIPVYRTFLLIRRLGWGRLLARDTPQSPYCSDVRCHSIVCEPGASIRSLPHIERTPSWLRPPPCRGGTPCTEALADRGI
ncbi:MAG: hypothetical protein WB775_09250, partial [Burkholderiaceae bacterium]